MTPYEKFIKIADEAHYFDQHQEVLVALSGGLDSMTLFNWLYAARDLLNISLSVAHINHQQRAVLIMKQKPCKIKWLIWRFLFTLQIM